MALTEITTKSIKDGEITNADLHSSAAIATSKLSGAVASISSHGLAASATTDTTNAANIGSGTLPAARIGDDSIVEGKLDIHNAPSGTDKYLKYTSNGMEWATAGGANIVQILQGQTNTQYTTTSSSFQDTDCTVTITTNAAASKILVLGNPFVGIRSENGVDAYGRIELLRDTTQLRVGFYGAWMGNTSGLTTNHYHSPSFTYLDTGVSASTEYVYKIKYCLTSSSAQAQFNPHSGHGGSHITVIEMLT